MSDFPPNPFAGADFEKLSSLDKLERKLRPHWSDIPGTIEGWLGQILTSAVIHGGLVAPQAWGSWLTRVQSRQFQIQGPPYIVFRLRNEKGRSAQRRWFADPLTAALLRRWKKAALGGDGQLPPPEALIHDYCRTSGADVGEEAAAFMGWFRAAAALRLRLRVPGVLADYAAGIQHSTAVPQPVWKNLLSTHDPEIFASEPAAAHISNLKVDLSPAKRYWRYKRLQGPIAPLLNHLSLSAAKGGLNRREEAKLVRAKVKELLGTRTPSGLLDRAPRTVREAVYNLFGLLSYSGRRKGEVRLNRVRLSTQLSYLGALARYDWMGCWTRRFEDAPPDLMHPIFEAVVRAAPKDREGTARSIARKLDEYICHHWKNLEPWPNRGQWPDTSGGVAEILSGAQFNCALRLIDELRVEPRHRQMIRLAAILMFRAGIRGREVRHLRIGDLDHHAGLIELTVRLNDDVTLKSLSSYRRLPLDILLEKEERDELVAWHRRRIVETRGDMTRLLFPAGDSDACAEEPCTDAALLHPIEHILAVILRAADPDARIRRRPYALGTTLRHSFCSYLLATLLLPEDQGGLALPEGIGPELVSLDRKRRVSKRLLGQGRLGQSATHAVSTLMGHAHISRLLGRYAHLLDWSLAAYLHRRSAQIPLQPAVLRALVTPSPSLENIRKRTRRRLAAESQFPAQLPRLDHEGRFLAIVPPARARRTKGRPRAGDQIGGSCFLDHFVEPAFPGGPAYQPWLPPRESLPDIENVDVAEAIIALAARGVALARIAELVGISLESLLAFITRAGAVATLTAGPTSPSSQTPLQTSAFRPALMTAGWLRPDQRVPAAMKKTFDTVDQDAQVRDALMRIIRRPLRPTFQFRKEDRARAFADTLVRIGISPDCITIGNATARSGSWFAAAGQPAARTRVKLTLDSATRTGLALLVATSGRIPIEALTLQHARRRCDATDTDGRRDGLGRFTARKFSTEAMREISN